MEEPLLNRGDDCVSRTVERNQAGVADDRGNRGTLTATFQIQRSRIAWVTQN
jgi:hypothetical protein